MPPEDDCSAGPPSQPASPTPIYREVDVKQVGEALRRQVGGAQQLAEAFEKAKAVTQESLDYEVSL